MNPKRIQHGDRKGIEIKKFDQTTESMQYGELFLRFRKRDRFLVTRPAGNMVILKTQGGGFRGRLWWWKWGNLIESR
jgi:hypothetical protein